MDALMLWIILHNIAVSQLTTVYIPTTTKWPEPPTFTEYISKNGHYIATVDDPENVWRCRILLNAAPQPESALIICIKNKEVEKELK